MDESANSTNKNLAGSSDSNLRIYEFLRDNRVGVLATVDGNNDPHAAVVYFSVDEDFTIKFVTKTGTRKHSNLMLNNKVMFISFDEKTQTTAQVIGYVEEIGDRAEVEVIHGAMIDAAMLTSDDGDQSPVDKLDAGDYVAYRIKPDLIRMAVFIRPESAGGDAYETIDFKH